MAEKSGRKFKFVSAILRDRWNDQSAGGEREPGAVALRLSPGERRTAHRLEGARGLAVHMWTAPDEIERDGREKRPEIQVRQRDSARPVE